MLSVVLLLLIAVTFIALPFVSLGYCAHFFFRWRDRKRESGISPELYDPWDVKKPLIAAVVSGIVFLIFTSVVITFAVMITRGIVYM